MDSSVLYYLFIGTKNDRMWSTKVLLWLKDLEQQSDKSTFKKFSRWKMFYFYDKSVLK